MIQMHPSPCSIPGWFYVDDTDLTRKRIFQRIQMLFLTRLSEAPRGTQTTPLLTIAVK
jgi:hypothetical protein